MKSVLITGASSGIGLQLAKDYAADGWSVTACGRDEAKLSDQFDDLAIDTLSFDITDQQSSQAALENLDSPDLVILNAGSCEYVDDPLALEPQLFSRVLQTNVVGLINTLAPILPRLKAGSRVAIVSSSVTFVAFPRAEAYGASKAAVNYLARSLAVDLKPHDIDVSLVQPGFVDTPLTRKNDFPMPSLVSVEEASLAIRAGLAKGKSTIAFPFLFIQILRLISLLPSSLWVFISQGMVRRAS